MGKPSDSELLDAIEHYIMWPGPAAIEIHENAANRVVVKSSGGKPALVVVEKDLRAALVEWYRQVVEKDSGLRQGKG